MFPPKSRGLSDFGVSNLAGRVLDRSPSGTSRAGSELIPDLAARDLAWSPFANAIEVWETSSDAFVPSVGSESLEIFSTTLVSAGPCECFFLIALISLGDTPPIDLTAPGFLDMCRPDAVGNKRDVHNV